LKCLEEEKLEKSHEKLLYKYDKLWRKQVSFLNKYPNSKLPQPEGLCDWEEYGFNDKWEK